MEITVLVTLVVYWLAEQYATLLGEHTHSGKLPSVRTVGRSLGESWPMVSSSFLPLLALLVARLFGSDALGASEVAISVTVVLLVIHAHAAGKAAALTGVRLYFVTAAAGLLGLVMIALKALIQRQHHIY